MISIAFPWRAYPSDLLGYIYRPTANVTLKGPAASLSSIMLIDTGADISIIPQATGEYLGLKRLGGEPELEIEHKGITISYVIRNIEMTIGDYNFTAPVAWSQDDNNTRILGRYGVFKYFAIEFREPELKTIFYLWET